MDTVSTGSNSSPAAADQDFGARKARHLEICIDESRYRVETGATGFEQVQLVHSALPELGMQQIDPSVSFLGQRIPMPILISSMTGGSSEGFRANKDLARAAQRIGIPVGMGSIRVLFRHPEVFDHFHLKKLAPDVPVMANIGGVQVRDLDHTQLLEMLKRLEVQALVIHLNPGQELFQPEGDRDFRGVIDAIRALRERSPLPLIVKETGFGIRPSTIATLFDAGVEWVNVAGAGGTNWVKVESYRLDDIERQTAEEFDDWGLSTALILAAAPQFRGRLIASGGVRSGIDLTKAVALGAGMVGLALPFIRAVKQGGVEGVASFAERLKRVLSSAMLLCGARTIADLQRTRTLWTPAFRSTVEQLRELESQPEVQR
ncbi:MAG: type 2 isopentenyl-diphosphate Delta-isomerase [Spirochaetaceae bacterium]|nr:MAG: type 2 isopentenyl-diphosphate Delta-isomerase [Spirochaetaceae bacterium]